MKKSMIRVDAMLLATFVTTLFYSATHPYINKVIMSNIEEPHIAINQLITCLSTIFIGFLWNKKSDKLFKYYAIFCIMETLMSIITTVFVLTTNNIVTYYILDTIVFSVVTRNIICGGIKLRSLRYNENERAKFDNDNNTAAAVATIVGSLIAVKLNLPFSLMIIMATIGNCIDNVFYIYIFYSMRRRKK